MRSSKGFTMVELLVVLIILAILAAVATPIYLANVNRARAAEAVAGMSLIRQAIREYTVSHPAGVTLPMADITAALPAGVEVDLGVTKYFSNAAYSVVADASAATVTCGGQFSNPTAVDFVVAVDGTATITCAAAGDDDCATDGNDVKGDAVTGDGSYHLVMDNSGRTFVFYDDGGTCSQY
jgi:type IV pilus assembly protein PilE